MFSFQSNVIASKKKNLPFLKTMDDSITSEVGTTYRSMIFVDYSC